MLHAREDYNRFQDPLGIIPKNEPVMLFRGQDKYAANVVRIYAAIVEDGGGDLEIVRRCREQACRMDAWPVKKSPDLPPGSAKGPRPDVLPGLERHLSLMARGADHAALQLAITEIKRHRGHG